MARRKNPADDFKFEIVQGPEMTEEDLDAIARICARIIYDQIMKEQQAQKEDISEQSIEKRDDQSSLTAENE
jgi:hypothetical protein